MVRSTENTHIQYEAIGLWDSESRIHMDSGRVFIPMFDQALGWGLYLTDSDTCLCMT